MNKVPGYPKLIIGAASAWRRSCLSCIALPFLLAGIATAADHAAPTGSEATEIRVHYELRDLTSSARARRLLNRIGDAALESCGASSFSLPELRTAVLASECWRDAVDAAVRRIGSPLLSAAASEDRR